MPKLDDLPEDLLFEICSFLLPQYEDDSSSRTASSAFRAAPSQSTQFPVGTLELLNPNIPIERKAKQLKRGDEADDDDEVDFSVRMALLDREAKLLSKGRQSSSNAWHNRWRWYRKQRAMVSSASATEDFKAQQTAYNAQIRFVFGSFGLVSRSIHEKVYSQGFWHRHVFTYDYMHRLTANKKSNVSTANLLDESVFGTLLKKCHFSALHLMSVGYGDDTHQKRVKKEKQKRGEELRTYDPLQSLLPSGGQSAPALKVLKLSNAYVDVNKLRNVFIALSPTLEQMLLSNFRVSGTFEDNNDSQRVIFPRLESFNIRLFVDNSSESEQAREFAHWVLRCASNRLRYLGFTSSSTPSGILQETAQLIANCQFASNLRALTLAIDCFSDPCTVMSELLSKANKLRHLSLYASQLPPRMFYIINQHLAPCLETLKIKVYRDSEISDLPLTPLCPFERLRSLRLHFPIDGWGGEPVSEDIFRFFKEALAKQTVRNLDIQLFCPANLSLETRNFVRSFANLEYIRAREKESYDFVETLLTGDMPHLYYLDCRSHSYSCSFQATAARLLASVGQSLRFLNCDMASSFVLLKALSCMRSIEIVSASLNYNLQRSMSLPDVQSVCNECASLSIPSLRSLVVNNLSLQDWIITRTLLNMLPSTMQKLHIEYDYDIKHGTVPIELLGIVSAKFLDVLSLKLSHPDHTFYRTAAEKPKTVLSKEPLVLHCMPSVQDAVISVANDLPKADPRKLVAEGIAAVMVFPNAETVSLILKHANTQGIRAFFQTYATQSTAEDQEDGLFASDSEITEGLTIMVSVVRSLVVDAAAIIKWPDEETHQQAIEHFLHALAIVEEVVLAFQPTSISGTSSTKDVLDEYYKSLLPSVQHLTYGVSALQILLALTILY